MISEDFGRGNRSEKHPAPDTCVLVYGIRQANNGSMVHVEALQQYRGTAKTEKWCEQWAIDTATKHAWKAPDCGPGNSLETWLLIQYITAGAEAR